MHSEDNDIAEVSIRKPKRRIVIEPYLFLNFLSFAFYIPVPTQFLYQRLGNFQPGQSLNTTGCYLNKSDPQYVLEQQLQSETSNWSMYITLASGVPAMFTVFFWGSYSDRRGRTFPLAVALLGSASKICSLLVVDYFGLPLPYIFIGCFMDGLAGSFATTLTLCFAYISDMAKGKERSIRIACAEGLMGAAVALGQISCGYLIRVLGFWAPLLLSITFLVLALFYLALAIPETIIVRTPRSLLNRDTFLQPIMLYFPKPTEISKHKLTLLRLMLLLFPFVIVQIVSGNDAKMLFQLNEPLCWSSVTIGYYNGMMPAVWIIGGFTCFFIGYRVLKLRDLQLICIATCTGFAAYVWNAFTTKTWMMFMVPFIGAMTVLIVPISRAFMSKLVTPAHQGALFASISIVETACSSGGTALFNSIYSATVNFFHGFLFLVEALLYLVAFGISLCMLVLHKRHQKSEQLLPVEADNVVSESDAASDANSITDQ